MKRFTALLTALVLLLLVPASAFAREITDEELALLEKYSRIESLMQTLMDEYYIELDEETLLQGAIDGMFASLDDPYSFFYTKEEMEKQKEESSGEYKGVGMSVTMNGDGKIRVVRVFMDSPADVAGLLSGDLLVGIDGDTLDVQNAKDLDEAVMRLRGTDYSEVTLTIERGGETFDVTVTRGDININYTEFSMIDEIGYIQIFQFESTTAASFRTAEKYLKECGAQGLIVDLRDNPGGMLDSVVEICDELLGRGKVVYTIDRAGNMTTYYSDDAMWDIPLVVLINGNSASASEIFSAAMQDYDRGTVMGTTSFGKGIVQVLYTYPDGTGVQFTESSYYTPSGRSIHKIGVDPDIVVELREDYDPSIHGVDLNNDNQLAAAVGEIRRLISGQADESNE